MSAYLSLQGCHGDVAPVYGPRDVVFTFLDLKMTFSVYESSTIHEDCIIGTDMLYHFDIATRIRHNMITVYRDDRGILPTPREIPVNLENSEGPSPFAAGRVFLKVRASQLVALQPASTRTVPLKVITHDNRATAIGDTRPGPWLTCESHPCNTTAPPVSHSTGAEGSNSRAQTDEPCDQQTHEMVRGAGTGLQALPPKGKGNTAPTFTLKNKPNPAPQGQQDSPDSHALAYAKISHGLLKIVSQSASVEVVVQSQQIQFNSQSTPQVTLVNDSKEDIPKTAVD